VKLSIVTTLYKSAPYIKEFHRRASEAAQRLAGEQYEIIMVNDGSPDDSLETALSLVEEDMRLKVVDLSRNFGHHKAMMTGLKHAQGERVFLIDVDLEEAPEWLTSFAEQQQEQQCDVIYGVQAKRKGKFWERCSGGLFYKIFNLLSGMSLPENITTARLMSRRYVNALLRHREREIYIAGLWHITGFSQQPHTVTKASKDTTTYTLSKKIALLVNSLTSFSNAPLLGIFYLGLGIFCTAMCYTAYLIVKWYFLAKPPSGWTSVMASIWLLGGMIMLSAGIIGIYVSKVLSETKKRPYTLIRAIYKKQEK